MAAYNPQSASGEVDRSNSAPAPDFSAVYSECISARDEFLVAVNEYLTKNDQEPLPAILSSSHGWDDVFISVSSACDTLERLAAKDKEVRGVAGRLKKAYRTLCKNAEIGAGFIGLIPNDQMYTAALCCGLKVIFNALQNAGRHRQTVFSALEELPLILDDRAASIDIYSDDEELHRRMAALYVATLKAYRTILQYFIGNKVKAGLKHLLPNTNEKLKEKITEVKLRGDQFRERALVILQKQQNESYKLASRVYADTSEIKNDTREIRNLLNGGDLRELIERLKNFFDEQDIIQEKKRGRVVVAQDPASSTDLGELLSIFEYDPELVFGDCQKLINMRQNQNSLDDAKVLFIIQSSELRDWLLRPHSMALLVNGRSISQQRPETSFFSAKLFASLFSVANTPSSNIIALSFYCSRHRDERTDPNANPLELAMSLLLQLLDSYSHFKPSLLQRVRETLDPLDLGSILEVINHLVTKVRQGMTIFIVIDGISFFTSPAQRLTETGEVMAALIGLVRQTNLKATIKAVFTSPVRVRDFEELFLHDDGEILNMPREVGHKVLYRDSQWERLVLPDTVEIGEGKSSLITGNPHKDMLL
ncbi:putative Fungal STAND N-terminal Goodbye domain-containing protein [Seiridium unicorne]|uniref:Fungal STAND N-terminal Goodbye domain-containing protein n=1 Tax=Seiridium unicorne TaxID=138068 RepID=A0ABR2V167_9PEZI